jgi:hypothetical protein
MIVEIADLLANSDSAPVNKISFRSFPGGVALVWRYSWFGARPVGNYQEHFFSALLNQQSSSRCIRKSEKSSMKEDGYLIKKNARSLERGQNYCGGSDR